MKSKQHFNKKSNKRSAYNELDDRKGLKPIKSKSGKASKKISIYDAMDDEFDNFEFDNSDFYKDQDFELENDDDEY